MKQIFNYITTNAVNGMRYIGTHYGHRGDNYLGSGTLLLKAIRIHGKNNFIKIDLCVCDSFEDAYLNEKKFIKLFDTLIPNGYNLSPTGGVAGPGFRDGLDRRCSEETKKRISNARKGHSVSQETRDKIRNKLIGSKLSEESIRKRTEKQKGVKRTDDQKKRISEKFSSSEYRSLFSEKTKAWRKRAKAEGYIQPPPSEKTRMLISEASKIQWLSLSQEEKSARAAKIWAKRRANGTTSTKRKKERKK